MDKHAIMYRNLSQEDLIKSGAFSLPMAINALKRSLIQFRDGDILFPEKIVQVFNVMRVRDSVMTGRILFRFASMAVELRPSAA